MRATMSAIVVATNGAERQLVAYVADSATEERGNEIDGKLTGEPRSAGGG